MTSGSALCLKYISCKAKKSNGNYFVIHKDKAIIVDFSSNNPSFGLVNFLKTRKNIFRGVGNEGYLKGDAKKMIQQS